MTKQSRNARTLSFIALVVLVFIVLITLPRLLERRLFKYTASEISLEKPKPFPMERALASLSRPGTRTTLGELAKAHKSGLIVNFWATWCPPCLEELPSLNRFDQQLRAQGRELPLVVTISVDDTPKEVQTLLASLPYRPGFLVLHDPRGELAISLGSRRYPETYWIRPSGEVIHKWLGPQDWLSETVLKVLAAPPSP